MEGESAVQRLTNALEKSSSASGNLEKATKGVTAAKKEKLGIFGQIINRITQGIPTMFSLVGAYKAMQAAINLVVTSLKDMDEELVVTQKFAQSINLFTSWTDGAGKAVSATDNWTRSVQVATAAQAFLQEAAKDTNFVWEELLKGSNEFSNSALARGVATDEILRLTVAAGKLNKTEGDLTAFFNSLNTFLKSPRMTNDLATTLGLSATQLKEIKKSGDSATVVISKLLPMLEAQAEATAGLEKTWSVLFKKIKEDALDAIQRGFGPIMEDAKAKVMAMLPAILRLVEVIARDLGEGVRSYGLPALKALGIGLVAVATGFDLAVMSLATLTSGFVTFLRVLKNVLEVAVVIGSNSGIPGMGFLKVAGQVEGLKGLLKDMDKDLKSWEAGSADVAISAGKRIGNRTREIADLTHQFQMLSKYGAAPGAGATDPGKAAGWMARIKELMAGGVGTNQIDKPGADTKALDAARKKVDELVASWQRAGTENALEKRLTTLAQQALQMATALDKSGASVAQRTAAWDAYNVAVNDVWSDSARASKDIQRDLESLGDTIDRELLSKDLSPYKQALAEAERVAKEKLRNLSELRAKIESSTLPNSAERIKLMAEADARHNHILDAKIERLAKINRLESATRQLQAGKADAYIAYQIAEVPDGRQVMDRLREIQNYVLENSQQFGVGVKFAIAELVDGIDSQAEAAHRAIKGIGVGIDAALREAISSGLRGDNKGFENAMKGLLDSLINVLSDYLIDMMKNTLKNGLGDLNGFLGTLFGGSGGDGTSADRATADAFSAAHGGLSANAGGDSQTRGGDPNWLQKNGGKLLAGAAGAWSLYQQARSGNLSILEGTMQGAMIGANFSWVGAIIGAVVGAIAGMLSGAQEAKSRKGVQFTAGPDGIRASAYGDNPLTQGEIKALEGRVNVVFDRVQKAWLEVLLALPDRLFDIIGGIAPGDLRFTNNENGGPRDSNRVPITGVRQIESQNYTKWIDLFLSDELPRAMLESYIPAVRDILSGLGFNQERMNLLVNRWRSMGENVYGEMTELVASVSALQDILQNRNYTDDLAAAQERASMTIGERQEAAFKPVQRMLQLLADPNTSLGTQVELVKRIRGSMDEMLKTHLQYLDQIAETARANSESIRDQILGIKLDKVQGDPSAQRDILMGELNRLDVLLQGATDPAQVAEYTGRMQQIIGQIYDLDPAAFADWAMDWLEKLDEYQNQRLDQLGNEAVNAWNRIVDMCEPAMTRFVGMLDDASDNPPDWEPFRRDLEDAGRRIRQFGEALTDATRNISGKESDSSGGQEVAVKVTVQGNLADLSTVDARVKSMLRSSGRAGADTGVY